MLNFYSHQNNENNKVKQSLPRSHSSTNLMKRWAILSIHSTNLLSIKFNRSVGIHAYLFLSSTQYSEYNHHVLIVVKQHTMFYCTLNKVRSVLIYEQEKMQHYRAMAFFNIILSPHCSRYKHVQLFIVKYPLILVPLACFMTSVLCVQMIIPFPVSIWHAYFQFSSFC